jgi:DNA-binding NtrC family response regulator
LFWNRKKSAAASEATVLVLGEGGTGTELIARSIQRRTARGGRNRYLAGGSPADRSHKQGSGENAMERAVVLGSAEQILPEDLPESILETAAGEESSASSHHASVQEAKRKIILTALESAGGVKTEEAKLLGVNPTYLSRLIRTLNLRQVATAV